MEKSPKESWMFSSPGIRSFCPLRVFAPFLVLDVTKSYQIGVDIVHNNVWDFMQLPPLEKRKTHAHKILPFHACIHPEAQCIPY